MSIKKIVFIILGCICLALGTVGVVLPILPTVPFYLATAFCFANSSERLHTWFVDTGLYKKHLQSYVEKRGMLLKTKISIITTVTLLISRSVTTRFREERSVSSPMSSTRTLRKVWRKSLASALVT